MKEKKQLEIGVGNILGFESFKKIAGAQKNWIIGGQFYEPLENFLRFDYAQFEDEFFFISTRILTLVQNMNFDKF